MVSFGGFRCNGMLYQIATIKVASIEVNVKNIFTSNCKQWKLCKRHLPHLGLSRESNFASFLVILHPCNSSYVTPNSISYEVSSITSLSTSVVYDIALGTEHPFYHITIFSHTPFLASMKI